MPVQNQQIALLLFTRTPDEEVRFKSLAPDFPVAKQQAVVTKLIQETRQKLNNTGLPFFICSSANQAGATFAEKLYNAFADLFAQGYQQVIAIGNDCPQLKSQDIQQAAKSLQYQDVVAGPDLTGGIYLFGLTQKAFNSCSSFNEIRWSTGKVLNNIARLFSIPAHVLAVLPVYSDINNHRDLLKAVKRKLFRTPVIHFFKLLFNLLNSYSDVQQFCFIPETFKAHLFFRGPPSRD